ncbi:hypothetical protein CANCADRAFT_42867 [Tortispora caseinolytica NRRL Y-17796]|uniref:Mediator of RNA polymerase II transcription subunit 13 n=1 Tax=Tortispora caseinolytica NRRL Y-17796 TaxID=767744 RepID=A0A1E4TKI1_9ASCO|nr:hypothetical protein CANCADRAFT_42867 [Tortispora caseinolytica NRRL Y-17796]
MDTNSWGSTPTNVLRLAHPLPNVSFRVYVDSSWASDDHMRLERAVNQIRLLHPDSLVASNQSELFVFASLDSGSQMPDLDDLLVKRLHLIETGMGTFMPASLSVSSNRTPPVYIAFTKALRGLIFNRLIASAHAVPIHSSEHSRLLIKHPDSPSMAILSISITVSPKSDIIIIPQCTSSILYSATDLSPGSIVMLAPTFSVATFISATAAPICASKIVSELQASYGLYQTYTPDTWLLLSISSGNSLKNVSWPADLCYSVRTKATVPSQYSFQRYIEWFSLPQPSTFFFSSKIRSYGPSPARNSSGLSSEAHTVPPEPEISVHLPTVNKPIDAHSTHDSSLAQPTISAPSAPLEDSAVKTTAQSANTAADTEQSWNETTALDSNEMLWKDFTDDDELFQGPINDDDFDFFDAPYQPAKPAEPQNEEVSQTVQDDEKVLKSTEETVTKIESVKENDEIEQIDQTPDVDMLDMPSYEQPILKPAQIQCQVSCKDDNTEKDAFSAVKFSTNLPTLLDSKYSVGGKFFVHDQEPSKDISAMLIDDYDEYSSSDVSSVVIEDSKECKVRCSTQPETIVKSQMNLERHIVATQLPAEAERAKTNNYDDDKNEEDDENGEVTYSVLNELLYQPDLKNRGFSRLVEIMDYPHMSTSDIEKLTLMVSHQLAFAQERYVRQRGNTFADWVIDEGESLNIPEDFLDIVRILVGSYNKIGLLEYLELHEASYGAITRLQRVPTTSSEDMLLDDADQTSTSLNSLVFDLPHIMVKRFGRPLKILPSVLPFWHLFGCQPHSGPLDATVYFVVPGSDGVQHAAILFLNSLKQCYKKCELGTLTAGSSLTQSKNESEEPNGVVPIQLNMDKLADKSLLQSSEILVQYSYAISQLGKALTKHTALDDRILLLIANPFDEDVSLFEICRSFCSIKEELGSRRIHLQVIPIDRFCSLDGYTVPTPKEYTNMALRLYEGLGASDNLKEDLNEVPSSFQIAKPIPNMIPFNFGPAVSDPLFEDNSAIHISYSRTADRRWIVASWTDNRGSFLFSRSFCLTRGSQRPKSIEEVIGSIWEKTISFARRKKIRWRIIVTRLGIVEEDEQVAWTNMFASAEMEFSTTNTVVRSGSATPITSVLPVGGHIDSSKHNSFSMPISTGKSTDLSHSSLSLPVVLDTQSSAGGLIDRDVRIICVLVSMVPCTEILFGKQQSNHTSKYGLSGSMTGEWPMTPSAALDFLGSTPLGRAESPNLFGVGSVGGNSGFTPQTGGSLDILGTNTPGKSGITPGPDEFEGVGTQQTTGMVNSEGTNEVIMDACDEISTIILKNRRSVMSTIDTSMESYSTKSYLDIGLFIKGPSRMTSDASNRSRSKPALLEIGMLYLTEGGLLGNGSSGSIFKDILQEYRQLVTLNNCRKPEEEQGIYPVHVEAVDLLEKVVNIVR